jgi:hypothetical protein
MAEVDGATRLLEEMGVAAPVGAPSAAVR